MRWPSGLRARQSTGEPSSIMGELLLVVVLLEEEEAVVACTSKAPTMPP